MKKAYIIISLFLVAVLSGCSINHPVADDYGQYLDKNTGTHDHPETKLKSLYEISEKTEGHRYEFRAATVGYAHLWIVEFGKVLDETLKSTDVQKAFGQLAEKKSDSKAKGYLITFDLDNYEFKNHMAHVSLNIGLEKNGHSVFSKTYQAQGKSQGGKMFWGGPFAMKNATQQSTKFALDQIITDFIHDVEKR
jgi:hypothetical protein